MRDKTKDLFGRNSTDGPSSSNGESRGRGGGGALERVRGLQNATANGHGPGNGGGGGGATFVFQVRIQSSKKNRDNLKMSKKTVILAPRGNVDICWRAWVVTVRYCIFTSRGFGRSNMRFSLI